jgi:IS4 transposase
MMRVSTSFYNEVNHTTTPDEIVEIVISKERAAKLKEKRTPIPIGTVIKVRVVKVELSTGEIETLITDVTTAEISYEECKALYFKRWGIETRYDVLKNQFEIENFSGETPTVIEQDFYATILLSNMASLIQQDAHEEMQKKNAHKTLKYDEYKINHNILVGKLKNRLVEILLEEDPPQKEAMKQFQLYKHTFSLSTLSLIGRIVC